MTFLKTLARAAGLGLCVAALSGTALADPGNGNGNGPATTPPGQEKKAETPAAAAPAPAPQAAQGQAQKAENQAQQAAKKAAPKPTASKSKSTAAKAAAPGQAKKAEKQAEKSERKADKAASKSSSSKGQSANAHHHVIICHRTGSESNPYVVINIPWTAWTNAHSDTTGSHPDKNGRHDIMLKDPASGPGSKDGFDKSDCESAAAPPAPSVTPTSEQKSGVCPTTITTTEQVLVGIWHATGSVKNGERKFVLISPSEKSAHMNGKHPDDRPATETRTVTRTVSGESCVQATVNQPPAGQAPTVVQPVVQGQPAGVTPAIGSIGTLPAQAAAPVGGVAGAVSPAPAAGKTENKPAGGVLGAIASAPEAVAETATSGTLPFTGIPLWIAALIGGALLATGLVLRRTTS